MIRDLTDQEVLALTLYGEARGESIEGQIAVGCVIRNRLTAKEGYKEVCLSPYQFSCWNSSDPNYPILNGLAEKLTNDEQITMPIYWQCNFVANDIISGITKDVTGGSKNYLTNDLYALGTITWARYMKVSAVIGSQTFLV